MKRYILLTLIFLLALSLSSCRLFRGKNKCNTCPSWKANIQQVDSSQEAKV